MKRKKGEGSNNNQEQRKDAGTEEAILGEVPTPRSRRSYAFLLSFPAPPPRSRLSHVAMYAPRGRPRGDAAAARRLRKSA